MKLILPKSHFSYSQMQLWLKSKEQYRARYYEDGPAFESIETIFGKRIARLLEEGVKDPVLDNIPRYKIMEHRVEQKIGGYPFLGYFDSFDKRNKSIYEYKTGHQPWDAIRVLKHEQLVIYSLLCRLAYKKVNPIIKLIWLQTRYKTELQKIGSQTAETDSNELEFTGKIQTFERKITEKERIQMKKKIVRIMQEISKDYAKYTHTAIKFSDAARKSWLKRKKDSAIFRAMQKRSVVARRANKIK